jgi:predicted transcriptional regulator
MEGKVPHEVHQSVENVHRIVHERYDPTENRIKTVLEAAVDKERAAASAPPKQPFVVRDDFLNDWTG